MRISDWSSDVCSSDLLVARIVAALDATTPAALPADLQAYARRLTQAWALLLAALALFDLWMALHATPEQWSWLANIGDYVVLLGFMLGEFAWRRQRLPGAHRGFFRFLRAVRKSVVWGNRVSVRVELGGR